MEQILGTNLAAFIGMTLVISGYCAWMTGQAIAATWRPQWQVFLYCVLLGFANRFMIYGLFDGELLSLVHYLKDTVILIAIGYLAYLSTRAAKMVAQYPWQYERNGPFGWRER